MLKGEGEKEEGGLNLKGKKRHEKLKDEVRQDAKRGPIGVTNTRTTT